MSSGDDELLAAAWAASESAYSPYSEIRVGAALLAEDGRVFAGCNVENASYGLTLCAERTALVRAVAEGVRRFRAIAIVGSRPQPMLPCGACRQVLTEFAPDLRVVIESRSGERVERRLGELLPDAYRPREGGSGGE